MIWIQKDKQHTVQDYRKRGEYRLLSMSKELILMKESDQTGTKLFLIRIQDGAILREWSVEKDGYGVITEGNMVILYDGKKTMEIFSDGSHKHCGTFKIGRKGELKALDACRKGETVYIACGCCDGTLQLYQYEAGKAGLAAESKLYGLSHLAFCGHETVAAADSEGEIHLALVDYQKKQIYMDFKKTMKLSIRCKNIRTDGLVPESIRIRLEEHS